MSLEKKMVGTRGGSEVPLLDEAMRLANIAENERKVRALIELKRNEALGGNKNPTEKGGSSQPSKKRKKSNNCPSEVANGGRNLRSQSRLNHDVEDPNNVPIGHGSDDIQVRSDPVAKAMVISTNQDTIVGGEVLGLQYYEVLVNVVFKREVELARGYDGMQTMGDAHHMSIAWPSNRIKPCSRSRL